jgi:hypothetical protein
VATECAGVSMSGNRGGGRFIAHFDQQGGFDAFYRGCFGCYSGQPGASAIQCC